MPYFCVDRPEVHIQIVYVEAADEKEALERVRDGEGHDVDNPCYSYTLDNWEDWGITEIPKETAAPILAAE